MVNSKALKTGAKELQIGGGELTIAAMDEYSRTNIGQSTYRFVRRCMRDPELRARIKARAAEIREGISADESKVICGERRIANA